MIIIVFLGKILYWLILEEVLSGVKLEMSRLIRFLQLVEVEDEVFILGQDIGEDLLKIRSM